MENTKQLIQFAIERLKRAAQYGDDMKTSELQCLYDTRELVLKAVSLSEVEVSHERGEDCGQDKCQTCCPHDERDHGICLDCGDEEDPGEAIDRAMSYFEDR